MSRGRIRYIQSVSLEDPWLSRRVRAGGDWHRRPREAYLPGLAPRMRSFSPVLPLNRPLPEVCRPPPSTKEKTLFLTGIKGGLRFHANHFQVLIILLKSRELSNHLSLGNFLRCHSKQGLITRHYDREPDTGSDRDQPRSDPPFFLLCRLLRGRKIVECGVLPLEGKSAPASTERLPSSRMPPRSSPHPAGLSRGSSVAILFPDSSATGFVISASDSVPDGDLPETTGGAKRKRHPSQSFCPQLIGALLRVTRPLPLEKLKGISERCCNGAPSDQPITKLPAQGVSQSCSRTIRRSNRVHDSKSASLPPDRLTISSADSIAE